MHPILVQEMKWMHPWCLLGAPFNCLFQCLRDLIPAVSLFFHRGCWCGDDCWSRACRQGITSPPFLFSPNLPCFLLLHVKKCPGWASSRACWRARETQSRIGCWGRPGWMEISQTQMYWMLCLCDICFHLFLVKAMGQPGHYPSEDAKIHKKFAWSRQELGQCLCKKSWNHLGSTPRGYSEARLNMWARFFFERPALCIRGNSFWSCVGCWHAVDLMFCSSCGRA